MPTVICVRAVCKWNNDEVCNHECLKPQQPINKGQYEACPACGECIPEVKKFIFCGFCGQRLQRE